MYHEFYFYCYKNTTLESPLIGEHYVRAVSNSDNFQKSYDCALSVDILNKNIWRQSYLLLHLPGNSITEAFFFTIIKMFITFAVGDHSVLTTGVTLVFDDFFSNYTDFHSSFILIGNFDVRIEFYNHNHWYWFLVCTVSSSMSRELQIPWKSDRYCEWGGLQGEKKVAIKSKGRKHIEQFYWYVCTCTMIPIITYSTLNGTLCAVFVTLGTWIFGLAFWLTINLGRFFTSGLIFSLLRLNQFVSI